MKIVKASAGSGKTHTLSHSYMDLLLGSDDRYAYRHVLAVTFTNKATAEMKARILRDLASEARTKPKARQILTDILHDYSAFGISTIDKFFQQTLRAFSREIGQFSQYQIELDRDSLITEAMDRILDSLTEDQTELLGWLQQSVMDKVEQGQRFSIEEGLYEIGKLLKTEEYRQLRVECGVPEEEAFGKERLSAIRKSCRKVIKDFEDRSRALGRETPKGEKVADLKKTERKNADPALVDLFDKSYGTYCTALMIDRLIFSLGLAGEFHKEFEALLHDRNVMPIDDSNTILRDIIDGSDAPFVYEKLGVRYEHFLLDEFQDTSRVQWDNFLPLLKESESRGGKSLIVGDVKQSIYRWRNSDWNLLGSEVGAEFPLAEVQTLENNWRSCSGIVNFNNAFFADAAKRLGLGDLYSDVGQKIKSKDSQSGLVRATFTSDQTAAVLSSIEDARAAGAMWKDIAILVRGNEEGRGIAEVLIGKKIPVVSDDSLHVNTSLTVRRLVSLLSCIDDPTDTVGCFLAASLGISPEAGHHSLLDLCEELLRGLEAHDPQAFEGEVLFVQAFMDDLRNWTEGNGNNVRSFLKHWKETDLKIGSPETSDAVRVMTIHKSKGLEFPYVIFPWADKVPLSKAGTHWCSIDCSRSELGSEVSGIYPAPLSGTSAGTLFEEAWEKEKEMQLVDNLNVFYVAMTRAVCCLHVIAKNPSKTCADAVAKKKDYDWKNLSELLFNHVGGDFNYISGTMYDFSSLKREVVSELEFPTRYASIPLGGRLTESSEALDFFGPEGQVGARASARINGIVLHEILSRVQRPEDLTPAVGQEEYELLSSRIAAHREWFDGNGRNEASIFGPDGAEHRPDRVVFGAEDGSVTVIDYKFGEPRRSHRTQVAEYCSLYRSLGYGTVRGLLWYVLEDRVEEIQTLAL